MAALSPCQIADAAQSSRTHRWSGFIKDSDGFCSFVVLKEKCLVFKLGVDFQHVCQFIKLEAGERLASFCVPNTNPPPKQDSDQYLIAYFD
jgi:hypothetical protein